MRPGVKAWVGLATGVVVYEVCCPPGELLSEAVDRGLANPRTEPFVVAAILATAAHLLNMLPTKYDPYVIAFKAVRTLRRAPLTDLEAVAI